MFILNIYWFIYYTHMHENLYSAKYVIMILIADWVWRVSYEIIKQYVLLSNKYFIIRSNPQAIQEGQTTELSEL